MSRTVCVPAPGGAIAVRLASIQSNAPPKKRERPMALTLTEKLPAAADIDQRSAQDDALSGPRGFDDVLADVESFWVPLPDKPEEGAEGVARALWLAAAGMPISVERATGV